MNALESGTTDGVLYYNFQAPAGFPSPAMDYMEERINLNTAFIKHPLSTFLINCSGDSMLGAFIPPKCKLLVDRSLTPVNGSIVFAVIDGEFTVKFLKQKGDKCWLSPANERLKDIEITPEVNMQIWGVVTTILIDTNDVRQCMP